jgi:RNA polymerase sigma-70 factor (ECF subfamily)
MDGTDAAVVARVCAGDRDAFRLLVDRHARTIFRLACRMVGSEQDADDVVQETFLRAYRQIGRFESRANFGTWLYRIGVNCSLDLLRQRPRRVEEQPAEDPEEPAADCDASASPERLALSAEVQAKVDAALRDLSGAERAAFLLRHFEGQSIEEIGRALGLRTSATKHTVFRAVRKMRRALEPLMASGAGDSATPPHGPKRSTQQWTGGLARESQGDR